MKEYVAEETELEEPTTSFEFDKFQICVCFERTKKEPHPKP